MQIWKQREQHRIKQDKNMRKIDLHMHVMTTWNLPKIGKINISNPKKMIAHMDELGIAKAVLMSSGEKKAPLGKNKTNRKICEKYPNRFAWMCTLDPVDEKTVYDRLAEYKRQGAIGIGEFTINRRLDDSFLQAVFEAAEKLELPVTIHMSPEVGYSYGDLSANSAGQAIMRDEKFGLAFLETYADRLFFATDMVNDAMVFPLSAWLDTQVEKGALSRDAYEKICWKNAQRIFGL